MSDVLPPTGTQWPLRRGGQHVVVTEVGATLREYIVDGQPILDGFKEDAIADGARGQPLLPWPNRLADGQYEFGGQRCQLPIDEPARNVAIHGLTRFLNWIAVEQSQDSITLQQRLYPRPGYPFTLQLDLTYSLTDQGLSVTTRAHNRGDGPAPYGMGQHPYFTVGTPTVDSIELQLPANQLVELDERQRVPTGRLLGVSGSDTDFRTARLIGANILDECYCGLIRDADGLVRARLRNPASGRQLTIWADQHHKYLQVFTGDTLAPQRRRQGVAIEAMTCPPNALRTGTDLIVLEPDASVETTWGIGI